jgi:rhodanese-related sulfurtransferase
MRRDLLNLAAVMVLSSVAAVAANVFGHNMEWIRRPLQPPPSIIPVATHPASAGEPAPASQPSGLIGVDDVLRHLADGSAFFVDAREAAEYSAGHLKGAFNVPSTAIYGAGEQIRNLVSLDHCVIVYCGGGGCEASHNVSDALRRDFLFKNVLIYEKGWEEIQASGRFTDWTAVGDQP